MDIQGTTNLELEERLKNNFQPGICALHKFTRMEDRRSGRKRGENGKQYFHGEKELRSNCRHFR